MKLPQLENPQRYRGLYIYDFGDWTAVGYTAEEIATLLESEAYRDGRAYKIHRALPDGQMELRGVSLDRFRLESGMLFYGRDLEASRADFESLLAAADQTPVPCRAFVHLADRGAGLGIDRFVTALVYPAESEDEIGHWLLEIDFQPSGLAEGGPSHVSNYYEDQKTVIDRKQIWSQPAIPSRSTEELLASVRQPVQRRLGA